jgi:hypothetical protein
MPQQISAELRQAKQQLSGQFLAPDRTRVRALAARRPVSTKPAQNIQGIGIGAKVVSGRTTNTLSVRVLVQMKYSLGELDDDEQIPATIGGFPTDVEEVGLVVPLVQPRARIRPVQPGCSVGFGAPDDPTAMAGTCGALVVDNLGQYLLSNNHVFADENRLPFGAPISQPGPLDGGNPTYDQIAAMCGYVPLEPDGDNYVDCAIALLDSDTAASANVLVSGPPSDVGTAQLHTVVCKSGRTTGFTRGLIVSTDTDLRIPYDIGTLLFRDQIAIRSLDSRSFSAPGDSGALIMDDQNMSAVGLLFAGGSSMSFANHIGDVLSALNVQLMTGS